MLICLLSFTGCSEFVSYRYDIDLLSIDSSFTVQTSDIGREHIISFDLESAERESFESYLSNKLTEKNYISCTGNSLGRPITAWTLANGKSKLVTHYTRMFFHKKGNLITYLYVDKDNSPLINLKEIHLDMPELNKIEKLLKVKCI